MTVQGKTRRTREPSGASGMTGHNVDKGAKCQGGPNESEGSGGVWESKSGGRDRSSCLCGTGDWKAPGIFAQQLTENELRD